MARASPVLSSGQAGRLRPRGSFSPQSGHRPVSAADANPTICRGSLSLQRHSTLPPRVARQGAVKGSHRWPSAQ